MYLLDVEELFLFVCCCFSWFFLNQDALQSVQNFYFKTPVCPLSNFSLCCLLLPTSDAQCTVAQAKTKTIVFFWLSHFFLTISASVTTNQSDSSVRFVADTGLFITLRAAVRQSSKRRITPIVICLSAPYQRGILMKTHESHFETQDASDMPCVRGNVQPYQGTRDLRFNYGSVLNETQTV